MAIPAWVRSTMFPLGVGLTLTDVCGDAELMVGSFVDEFEEPQAANVIESKIAASRM